MDKAGKIRQRYALVLALLFVLQLLVIAAVWLIAGSKLDRGTRAALLGGLAFLLLLGVGTGLRYLFESYLIPLVRLREELSLLTSNPSHRMTRHGAPEVRDLTDKLNALAEVHQALSAESQERIAMAKRSLAEEKNRLATLLAELAVGVVVCNLEGRILLFNKHALQLLEREPDQGGGQARAMIGLGRSLFGVIDRALVVHALEQIQQRLRFQEQSARGSDQASARQNSDELSTHFIAGLPGGQLVRARMAPVLGEAKQLNGFLLVLEDITQEVEIDSRRDAMLLALTRDARAALANLRAAVETLQSFADMDAGRRSRFITVIDEESQRLVRQVDRAQQEHGSVVERRHEFEEMRVADLLALLQRRIDSAMMHLAADESGIDHDVAGLWLVVDAFSLAQALAHWCRRFADHTGIGSLTLRARRMGGLVRIELSWRGDKPDADTLLAWEQLPLPASPGAESESFGQLLARHEAESVSRFDAATGSSQYWLLFPLSLAHQPLKILPRVQERPQFYDFDLFQQAGQHAALEQASLAQLSYTVFDTETTGLHPAAGDEIISIGAVRIVNGRLLQHEYFDCLIRPRCPLSEESTRIHGINEAMLANQPRVEQVLPQFERFIEDTVLVAHNAAFDLRFLQMQEEFTGVRLRQPVLDTLLLSQVIHPHQTEHTLEAIAARLGVAIVGRHTALGDAIVTAEVLLRMLPLLAEQGIHTLGQALEAEQQTRYARLRY